MNTYPMNNPGQQGKVYPG